MSVTVRDAVPEDVEGIAKVHVQAWRESYTEFLSGNALAGLSVEERIQMWRGVVAAPRPRVKTLVAENDQGAVVGFACGGPNRGDSTVPLGTDAEIYAIYLLARVKRQGIGRLLMSGLFRHLADHAFSAVGVWVLMDNHPARRFYERLGGVTGPEQALDFGGRTVMEVAYRFEPIPSLMP